MAPIIVKSNLVWASFLASNMSSNMSSNITRNLNILNLSFFHLPSCFDLPLRPTKPHRIWFATLIWTPSSSAKVQTRLGFFWNILPTITRSSPSSSNSFACFPSVMDPTVPTANLSPSLSLITLAKG